MVTICIVACSGIIPILLFYLVVIQEEPTQYDFNEGFAKCLKDIDFQRLGIYDFHVFHSLRLWCYGVIVTFHRNGSNLNLRKYLLGWNNEHNIDERGLLNDAIESAYTMYLQDLDTARELQRPARFNVSYEFDYHVLSKSLKHNDYVAMDVIIEQIDKLLEDVNGREC